MAHQVAKSLNVSDQLLYTAAAARLEHAHKKQPQKQAGVTTNYWLKMNGRNPGSNEPRWSATF
ncbi:hypothetical protein LC612_42430 [Nostoc sp. CHAB 5834]|nr:hypothetical protein [Nostoc sp. CHAB 5834]